MNQRVVVIGLGRSGVACARTLAADGYHVVVVDRNDDDRLGALAASLPSGVEVRLGGYPEDIAGGAAMVCPSPGVPWDAPELEYARKHGIPVRSEIDLVFERCHARMVGITGTNGKTTTSSLVAAMLEQGGNRVHLGGNIGTTMLDRLAGVSDGDWVVLELSSFQLETVQKPACTIACVLNVTPDHLDRHRSFDAYVETKRRLVRFALEDTVVGHDDEITRAMAAVTPAAVRYFGYGLGAHDGATVDGDDVITIESGAAAKIMGVADIPLFGRHNVLNVLAAVAIARAAGVDGGAIRAAVRGFHAVQHRLQTVLEEAGVLWVNDSKATNVESAVVALQSFGSRPIVWIGGGQGAGTAIDALVDEVARHARHAVLNGASAGELDAAFDARRYGERTVVKTLAEAVAAAKQLSRAGDVVLLAPGFKSFDQFHDFEERGELFMSLVRDLHRDTAARR